MGTVFRMLCGLVVIMLAGASCATGPLKDTASTAKQMVVITIDPETGSVVTVKDTSGTTLRPPAQGQSQVGTLATSTTPITIKVEFQPASTGTSAQSLTTLSTTCRIFYVNGVQYCR